MSQSGKGDGRQLRDARVMYNGVQKLPEQGEQSIRRACRNVPWREMSGS